MAKDTNSFWDVDWQKAQEQYLDSLKSFSSAMEGLSQPDFSKAPWLQSLDSWCHPTSGLDSKDQQEVFANLFKQSKIFYSTTEQFSELLQRMSEIESDSDEWRVFLDSYCEEMKTQFMQSVDESNRQQQNIATFWQDSLQQWLKELSVSSIFPHDTFQQSENFRFADFNKFFSTPGLGQTREYQEQLQKSSQLWQEYLDNYREYQEVMSTIGHDSVDNLREKILYIASVDKKISSLRELYDLWIDAQEEVYNKAVFRKDYSDLYGRLINSLMIFRQHNQTMLDKMLSAFNLPTSEEMENLGKAQQKLRRDIQFTQQQQEENQSEVESLKKELEEIRKGLSSIKDQNRKKKHE